MISSLLLFHFRFLSILPYWPGTNAAIHSFGCFVFADINAWSDTIEEENQAVKSVMSTAMNMIPDEAGLEEQLLRRD